MDTRLKNSKYNPIIKFSAIVLAIITAFFGGLRAIELMRKAYFYADNDREFATTPSFAYTIRDILDDISVVADAVEYYGDYTFDQYCQTEAALKIAEEFDAKEEKALKLFNAIQILKSRKPTGNSGESQYDGWYIDSQGLYRNDTLGIICTEDDYYYDYYNDYDIDIDEDSYIYSVVVSNTDDNGQEVTSVTYENSPNTAFDQLIAIKDSYTSLSDWEYKYAVLRQEIFKYVDDATDETTIKIDINSQKQQNLENSYYSNISQVNNILKKYVNVEFILTDNETGNSISNLSSESQESFLKNFGKSELYSIDFDGEKLNSPVPEIADNTNLLKFINSSTYNEKSKLDSAYILSLIGNRTLKFRVVREPVQGDIIYNAYIAHTAVKNQDLSQIITDTVFLFALCALFMVLACLFSGRQKDGTVKLCYSDKAPFVVMLPFYSVILFFLGCGIVMCAIADGLPSTILSTDNQPIIWLVTGNLLHKAVGVFTALFAGILLNAMLYIVRNLKNHSLANRFLIGFIFKRIFGTREKRSEKLINSVRHLRKFTIIGLCIYICTNVVLLAFVVSELNAVSVGLMAVFNILCLVYVILYLSDIARLNEIARKIRQGEFPENINENTFISPLKGFAIDLKGCRDNIDGAIQDAVRGEHLKTELITNVSHDLKTPLTSIISYVSLLKMCEIENEDAVNYINVLDEKSKKLKRLIEDLTEASKANSGNVKFNIEPVNLNEMALQAVGENSDVLESHGLDLVLTQNETELYVLADSQKTFRVMDNLFSNAKKYSLTGTRVYADVYKEDNYGVFSIKNISRDKLNFSPDELTERFVRGDNSRTTDGSGLGLSIARSFTELQGGIFRIQIDGDMFKVSVKLPLTQKQE